jgi:hypothetical protein
MNNHGTVLTVSAAIVCSAAVAGDKVTSYDQACQFAATASKKLGASGKVLALNSTGGFGSSGHWILLLSKGKATRITFDTDGQMTSSEIEGDRVTEFQVYIDEQKLEKWSDSNEHFYGGTDYVLHGFENGESKFKLFMNAPESSGRTSRYLDLVTRMKSLFTDPEAKPTPAKP